MTNLFQPPTDNLYKFVAVSGIVLFVAGIFVPPVFFRQTGMEYLAQLRSRDELRVHEKFTNERLAVLNIREQRPKEEKSKLQKRLDELESASNSAEVDKLEARIKEADREIDSIADAYHELSLNLALKRAQIKHEETVNFNSRRDARWFMGLGWIVALFGVFLSFVGFRRWYKRLQQFQDRVVAKEAEAELAVPTEADKKIEQGTPIQPTEGKVPVQPIQVKALERTKHVSPQSDLP